MVYVDANIFIYASGFETTSNKFLAARRVLREVTEGRLAAVTSVLSWDEITWVLRKKANREEAVLAGQGFLEFPNVAFIEVDVAAIQKAHELWAQYGLHPRDAIHAACAIRSGNREFISDDADFDKVKELKRIPLDEVAHPRK